MHNVLIFCLGLVAGEVLMIWIPSVARFFAVRDMQKRSAEVTLNLRSENADRKLSLLEQRCANILRQMEKINQTAGGN
jgi:hypothetical protein